VSKFHWKKQKAIGMYLNKRQWIADFDAENPDTSIPTEITTEGGVYIISEASSSSAPTYIITE